MKNEHVTMNNGNERTRREYSKKTVAVGKESPFWGKVCNPTIIVH